MIRSLVWALAIALPALPADAANLSVQVVDTAGRPVEDAVVTVRPAAGVPAGPIRFPWGTAMVQQNIAFNPHVLIVPVGATVNFPNKDKVRHHVYSFSKPAKFEIKLFGRDEARSYRFTSVGSVALGCNIHDRMSGFIKVVDTPFAGKSDRAGAVGLRGLPAGQATLTVWHPRLRARDNEQSFALTLPASGDVAKRITAAIR